MMSSRKKIISFFIIVSIVIQPALFVPTKQAFATFPVVDAAGNAISQLIYQNLSGTLPGNTQKETIWDAIAYGAARILIRQFTQSIVDWINSGFQGNPSFIQDPAQFVVDTADRTVGEFIMGTPLKFLCDPFKINIQVSLDMQYRPYQDIIRCTFTGILKNSKNAYNDFTNGGDFTLDQWFQVMTIPQNNAPGAMLIAQAQLDARIGDVVLLNKDELNWSGGLLSLKKCQKSTHDEWVNEDGEIQKGASTKTGEFIGHPFYEDSTEKSANSLGEQGNSVTETSCTTQTPGVLITDWMQESTSMDLKQLGVADELNEIVGALANFMITKMLQEGKGLLGYSDRNQASDDSAWKQGIASLYSQQNSAVNRAGSSYNPTSSSYGGLGYNPPTGSTSNDSALQTAKSQALSAVNGRRVVENQYAEVLLPISQPFFKMDQTYLEILSCYAGKLSANSGLTLSEQNRSDAQVRITNASTTIATHVAPYKEYFTSNSAISTNNLNALNQARTSIQSAQYADQIQDVMTSLNSITTWRGASDIDSLNQYIITQNISTSTIQGLQTNGDLGLSACRVFPAVYVQ